MFIRKEKTYTEYRQVKKEMQEYLTAKQTVEQILGVDRKVNGKQRKSNIIDKRDGFSVVLLISLRINQYIDSFFCSGSLFSIHLSKGGLF